MMKLTETLYDYHCREWVKFANLSYDEMMFEWDENDPTIPDRDDYITELAENYWAQFENEAGVSLSDVWNDIHFSAGVYIGEIEDTNITNRVIINDVKWYDDEGEEVTKEVDMVEVTLMNTNPDLYADNCEEAVRDELNKLIETKEIIEICELAELVGLNRVESITSKITQEIISNQPELLEVLAEWNQNHSVDEVITLFEESNKGSVTQLLEDMG